MKKIYVFSLLMVLLASSVFGFDVGNQDIFITPLSDAELGKATYFEFNSTYQTGDAVSNCTMYQDGIEVAANATANTETLTLLIATSSLTESSSSTFLVKCFNGTGAGVKSNNDSITGVLVDFSVPSCVASVDFSTQKSKLPVDVLASASDDYSSSFTYNLSISVDDQYYSSAGSSSSFSFDDEETEIPGEYSVNVTVKDELNNTCSDVDTFFITTGGNAVRSESAKVGVRVTVIIISVGVVAFIFAGIVFYYKSVAKSSRKKRKR